VPIVDSHCHVAMGWYEPVEALLRQMDTNEVERSILIQIRGQIDNTYQRLCVARHRDRLASVVIVNHTAANAVEALEREASLGAVGVRLPPDARSPGEDPLAIWRAAQSLGIAVSSGGAAEAFASAAFASLVGELPDLRIVIEHLGGTNHPEGDPGARLRRRVMGLAQFPNVYMKFHGLGEFAQRAMPVQELFPFRRPLPRTLQIAFDAFGPARMMWGSDFPPVSGREGYRNALRLPMEELTDLSDDERALAFGGVALTVFPI